MDSVNPLHWRSGDCLHECLYARVASSVQAEDAGLFRLCDLSDELMPAEQK